MANCTDIIQIYCANLNESDVTLKDLNLLKNCQKRFLEILNIIINDDKVIQEITQNLEQRSNQFENYKQTYNVMSYIDGFLQDLSEKLGKDFVSYFYIIVSNLEFIQLSVCDLEDKNPQ